MSKSAKPVSEIDRLIELASDARPGSRSSASEAANAAHFLSLDAQKDPNPSMWRVLAQLRTLLPYLAKVLPLLERGLLGTNLTGQSTPALDTSHIDRGIAGVGEAQRDLNTAIQSQAAEIRALQTELAQLNRSLEKTMLLNEQLASGMSSLRKLATTSVAVMVVLLVVSVWLLAFTVLGHR